MRNGFAALLCLALLAFSARADEVSGRFRLTDQDGRTVTEASYAGRVRVVSFGYTFCPDICPTTLSTVAAALDMLGAKASQVAPIFITVDPKRDSAQHLKEYVAAFGPSFIGLTGSTEQVDEAARAFRVRYAIQPPTNVDDPDSYFVDHSAGIYIMDRRGGFAAKLGHRADAEELAARLTEVIDQ
ncbi:MAG: SCO family protein [Bacteroidales bacterium]